MLLKTEIEGCLNRLLNMETFQGESADAIRTYIQEVHVTLLSAIRQCLREYSIRLLMYQLGYYKSKEVMNEFVFLTYPDIDDYVDVTVKKGTILYREEPNGTEYFATLDAIEQSSRDATKVFEGLQVEKNPIHGYREEMQVYLIDKGILTSVDIIKLYK